MKLIVISHNKSYPEEIAVIKSLFKSGMECFHLRKPGASIREIEDIIRALPEDYQSKTIIHNHHILAFKYKVRGIHFNSKALKNKFETRLKTWLYRRFRPALYLTASAHSLSGLMSLTKTFNYAFLSPVFDSISKSGYQSAFKSETLTKKLQNAPLPVVALGGVNAAKIKLVKEMNFSGAALLGAIWESDDPVGVFKEAKRRLEGIE